MIKENVYLLKENGHRSDFNVAFIGDCWGVGVGPGVTTGISS